MKPPPLKKTVKFRKLNSIEPDVLKKSISESPLCHTPCNTLEPLVQQYQHEITNILDSLAPVKSKSFVERPLIPWINNEILDCKKQKRRLEKQWRKTKLSVHYQMYQAEKKKLHALITNAKTDHYRKEVAECSGHQGRIFQIVAHLQNVKGKPALDA